MPLLSLSQFSKFFEFFICFPDDYLYLICFIYSLMKKDPGIPNILNRFVALLKIGYQVNFTWNDSSCISTAEKTENRDY